MNKLEFHSLRQRRHLINVGPSSTNSTINGDSGNVSQEEHEEDQERYFDKIERLKRTENEVRREDASVIVDVPRKSHSLLVP